MMNDNEVLDLFRPLVYFIAEILGPDSEVLLHDVSQVDQSVVEISNGHLSGRNLNSPLTDFAKNIIEEDGYEKQYLTNYSGYCAGKNFVSSTYFIKNNGKTIGMLCINKDTTLVAEFLNSVNNLITHYNLGEPTESIIEVLNESPVEQMVGNLVQDSIKKYGVSPGRLKKDEKIAIVNDLKALGVFSMKGAASEIAKQLNVSEPTIYRYLRSES